VDLRVGADQPLDLETGQSLQRFGGCPCVLGARVTAKAQREQCADQTDSQHDVGFLKTYRTGFTE
jgi:hypothetical protein